MPPHALVEAYLNTVESEMKRIGMWQGRPLAPEAFDFHQAFGGDTMSFSQWLQFVFVARVRQIIAEKGEFPQGSQVADQAFREWRMWGDDPKVGTLIDLLRAFDRLFQ